MTFLEKLRRSGPCKHSFGPSAAISAVPVVGIAQACAVVSLRE